MKEKKIQFTDVSPPFQSIKKRKSRNTNLIKYTGSIQSRIISQGSFQNKFSLNKKISPQKPPLYRNQSFVKELKPINLAKSSGKKMKQKLKDIQTKNSKIKMQRMMKILKCENQEDSILLSRTLDNQSLRQSDCIDVLTHGFGKKRVSRYQEGSGSDKGHSDSQDDLIQENTLTNFNILQKEIENLNNSSQILSISENSMMRNENAKFQQTQIEQQNSLLNDQLQHFRQMQATQRTERQNQHVREKLEHTQDYKDKFDLFSVGQSKSFSDKEETADFQNTLNLDQERKNKVGKLILKKEKGSKLKKEKYQSLTQRLSIPLQLQSNQSRQTSLQKYLLKSKKKVSKGTQYESMFQNSYSMEVLNKDIEISQNQSLQDIIINLKFEIKRLRENQVELQNQYAKQLIDEQEKIQNLLKQRQLDQNLLKAKNSNELNFKTDIIEKSQMISDLCNKLKKSTQIIGELTDSKMKEEKYWREKLSKIEFEYNQQIKTQKEFLEKESSLKFQSLQDQYVKDQDEKKKLKENVDKVLKQLEKKNKEIENLQKNSKQENDKVLKDRIESLISEFEENKIKMQKQHSDEIKQLQKIQNGSKQELQELNIILQKTKDQKQQVESQLNQEICKHINKIEDLEKTVDKLKNEIKDQHEVAQQFKSTQQDIQNENKSIIKDLQDRLLQYENLNNQKKFNDLSLQEQIQKLVFERESLVSESDFKIEEMKSVNLLNELKIQEFVQQVNIMNQDLKEQQTKFDQKQIESQQLESQFLLQNQKHQNLQEQINNQKSQIDSLQNDLIQKQLEFEKQQKSFQDQMQNQKVVLEQDQQTSPVSLQKKDEEDLNQNDLTQENQSLKELLKKMQDNLKQMRKVFLQQVQQGVHQQRALSYVLKSQGSEQIQGLEYGPTNSHFLNLKKRKVSLSYNGLKDVHFNQQRLLNFQNSEEDIDYQIQKNENGNQRKFLSPRDSIESSGQDLLSIKDKEKGDSPNDEVVIGNEDNNITIIDELKRNIEKESTLISQGLDQMHQIQSKQQNKIEIKVLKKDKLQQQIFQQQQEISHLKIQVDKLKEEALDSTVNNKEAALQEQNQNFEDLRQQYDVKQKDFEQQNLILQKQLINLTEQINSQVKIKNDQNAPNEDLRKMIYQNKQLQSDLQNLQANLESEQTSKDQLQQTFNEKQEQIDDLLDDVKQLTETLEEKEDELMKQFQKFSKEKKDQEKETQNLMHTIEQLSGQMQQKQPQGMGEKKLSKSEIQQIKLQVEQEVASDFMVQVNMLQKQLRELEKSKNDIEGEKDYEIERQSNIIKIKDKKIQELNEKIKAKEIKEGVGNDLGQFFDDNAQQNGDNYYNFGGSQKDFRSQNSLNQSNDQIYRSNESNLDHVYNKSSIQEDLSQDHELSQDPIHIKNPIALNHTQKKTHNFNKKVGLTVNIESD